jgi:anti-anti-sigma factor
MWPAGGDGSAAPLPRQGSAPTQAVITVERRAGSALITVIGEIDLANAETAEQQILQGITGDPTTVTVDLTGLQFIDSAGLWILFRLGAALTTAKITGEIVVAPDGPVRRMVDTAGITAAIPVRTL